MRTRLDWDGEAVERRLTAAAERGLRRGLSGVLRESNREVPYDTGELFRSSRTDMETTYSEIIGQVSYNTVYAVIQHERLDYRHAPGRKAKYLEDPLFREARNVLNAIASELRGAI